MKSSYRDLLIYAALAIVIAIAVAFAVGRLTPSSYSLSVGMHSNSTGTIYPYQTSKFTIQVNNTGSASINNLVVGLYLNGTELRYYTVTVPSRRNVTMYYNYTYTTSGSFHLQAIADPGRLLNIVDRNSTQSSALVNVSAPELPNVYKSVPNSNVTGTQSFALSGTGIYSASAIAQAYNLSIVNNMFSTSKNIMVKVFDNLYGFVASVYGAYANYADGASAYVVWMQGTVDPGLVDYVVSTFRVPMSNVTIAGTRVTVARTNNQTSMCTSYSNGWTKLLVYYNNSKNTTCLSVMSEGGYLPTISNSLVNALNASRDIVHYQSAPMYLNSTKLGTSLWYSNLSLGVMNFSLNSYGLFIRYVQRLSNAVDVTANHTLTCYGIVYNKNDTHACSYIVAPSDRDKAQGFGLVNTTEVTSNYTITIYSLVNESELLAAHQNAASLINALRVNQSSAIWVQALKNTCLFYNSSNVLCGVNSFDYVNNTANLSVTNRLNSSIRIDNIACHIPEVKLSSTVNKTVESNSSMELEVPCYNIPVPVPVAATSYTLIVNYTYRNVTNVVVGTLNVTYAGFH